jgi:hypothetical protein
VGNPIWGIGSGGAHRGGLTEVKQVGGWEPVTTGWRRDGGCWLRVRGAAVCSGGGHCGDGGARRWPEVALNGKAASAGEVEGGWPDALMIPYGGRRLNVVADLAWLQGTPGRCSVVSVLALGAEERGERQSGTGERSASVAEKGGQARLFLGAGKMRAG